MAVRILKEHLDLGRKWPPSYTLPTGRSIESLCDRAADLPGEIPADLLPLLRGLTTALSVAEPNTRLYRDYALVLREIADRLALPLDQRERQRRRSTWEPPR
jgi:hypothetical protein